MDPTSIGSQKKQEFQKNIYFSFTDYANTFDCVDHNKLRKILKEMGIPDHLTCLLRNLCAGQEATVKTKHGITDWFQTGEGVHQGCILYPAYLAYMQSTSCEMPRWMKHKLELRLLRNINNLRYADDTILLTESKKELRSVFMKMKEESEKAGLKFNI